MNAAQKCAPPDRVNSLRRSNLEHLNVEVSVFAHVVTGDNYVCDNGKNDESHQ